MIKRDEYIRKETGRERPLSYKIATTLIPPTKPGITQKPGRTKMVVGTFGGGVQLKENLRKRTSSNRGTRHATEEKNGLTQAESKKEIAVRRNKKIKEIFRRSAGCGSVFTLFYQIKAGEDKNYWPT